MSIIDDALQKSKRSDDKPQGSSGALNKSSKVSLIDQVLEREPKKIRLDKGLRKGFWVVGLFFLATVLTIGISKARKDKIPGWDVGAQKEKTSAAAGKSQAKKAGSGADSSGLRKKFTFHRAEHPDLTVSGIVYGSGKPFAIIEGQIANEGDVIHGAKLTKIYPRTVEFQYGVKKFTLKVSALGEQENRLRR